MQSLGIFGITDAERSAGVDNLGAVGVVVAGSCHRTVPAVTVAAPPTNTIAVAKVVIADNTIGITNHGFRTGTKLTYLSSSGSVIAGLANKHSIAAGIARAMMEQLLGDLTTSTFALASSLSNAQAGTALALTGTGHAAQTLIGDTATATATVTTGKVSRIAIACVVRHIHPLLQLL